MKKFLFSILAVMIVGLCDVRSQYKYVVLGDTSIVIERLTQTEADNRKAERIRSAQADNSVSNNWNVDDFRTRDKRLEEDYKRIVAGLKKKGINYKELTQKEFREHLTSGDDKVVYLTTDYSVREDRKKYLTITMSFRLLTADKKLLLHESAKGILKQVRVK